MTPQGFGKTPQQSSYDVIMVGGAIMGASTAWFLTDNPDFNGSVLVVERDPTNEKCSTAHANPCMRQQFSTELNVRISQFAANFVKNICTYMGEDDRAGAGAVDPVLRLHVSRRQRGLRRDSARESDGSAGRLGS